MLQLWNLILFESDWNIVIRCADDPFLVFHSVDVSHGSAISGLKLCFLISELQNPVEKQIKLLKTTQKSVPKPWMIPQKALQVSFTRLKGITDEKTIQGEETSCLNSCVIVTGDGWRLRKKPNCVAEEVEQIDMGLISIN